VARKKQNKSRKDKGGFAIKIPEGAKRKMTGILMFVLALIFVFAFFQKAGFAGTFLFSGAIFVVGKAVFLIPLFLVVTGLVFFGMRYWGLLQVLFALLLLFVGTGGILGTVARSQELQIQEIAGWLGFLVSWPVFSAFGFWVSEIIFGALVGVSGVIFWHLLDHERIQESSFAQGAKEKVRRIFEPKFEVKEVDSEIKDDDLKPEEQEKDEPKKKKEEENEKGFQTLPLAGDYQFPPSSILETESGVPNAGDIKIYSAIIKKTYLFNMECYLCKKNIKVIDFKETSLLRNYISGLGKIRPKTKTGLCSTHQRRVAKAIKRSRHIGLLSASAK